MRGENKSEEKKNRQHVLPIEERRGILERGDPYELRKGGVIVSGRKGTQCGGEREHRWEVAVQGGLSSGETNSHREKTEKKNDPTLQKSHLLKVVG